MGAVIQQDSLEPAALISSALFGAAVLLQSVVYGFAYRIGNETQVVLYFASASLLFFGAMALMVSLTTNALGRPSRLVSQADQENIASILLSLIVAASYYFSPVLSGKAPILLAGILVVTSAAGVLLKRPRPVIWFAAFAGIVLHFVGVGLIPIDVNAANMLPIIVAGCEDLLAGENPFMHTYPGIATAPLYYLPGMVLPYCAPVAAGLDPRTLNLAILVLLLGLLFKFQRFSSQPSGVPEGTTAAALLLFKFQRFSSQPALAALTTLPALFSPAAMQMGYYGHVWFYWLLVVGLGVAVLRGRYLLAAIWLGFVLATRQMAVFLYGMLGATLVHGLGLVRSLGYGMLAAGVFAILVFPFLGPGVSLSDFYYGGVQTAASDTHGATLNPADQVALSGLFVWLGFRDWMMPLQISLAVLVMVMLLLMPQSSRHATIIRIGVGYIFIIGLSAFLHRYFYMPGLLLIAVGLGEWLSVSQTKSPRTPD